MNNEVFEYRTKYIKKDSDIFHLAKKRNFFKIIEYLHDAKIFDRPDLFYVSGKTIYIFEHFEFDSSPVLKHGGSLNRLEEARDEKEFNKKCLNNGDIICGQLHSKINSVSYIDNLIKNFDEHYNKISYYKKHICEELQIRQSDYSFVVCFIIEDTTNFGNIYLSNHGPINLFPNQAFEFLKHIKNKKEVSYCICSSETYPYGKPYSFIFRHKNIDELLLTAVKVLKIELVDLNLMTIRGSFFIPIK